MVIASGRRCCRQALAGRAQAWVGATLVSATPAAVAVELGAEAAARPWALPPLAAAESTLLSVVEPVASLEALLVAFTDADAGAAGAAGLGEGTGSDWVCGGGQGARGASERRRAGTAVQHPSPPAGPAPGTRLGRGGRGGAGGGRGLRGGGGGLGLRRRGGRAGGLRGGKGQGELAAPRRCTGAVTPLNPGPVIPRHRTCAQACAMAEATEGVVGVAGTGVAGT